MILPQSEARLLWRTQDDGGDDDSKNNNGTTSR
jgi:hypothetical protein